MNNFDKSLLIGLAAFASSVFSQGDAIVSAEGALLIAARAIGYAVGVLLFSFFLAMLGTLLLRLFGRHPSFWKFAHVVSMILLVLSSIGNFMPMKS
jgi:hypothetical protein